MPTSLLRAGPLAADYVSGANRPKFGVRNGHRIAIFPDSIVTVTFFTFNMPTVFASGDIEVKIQWMAESAVTGDVAWAVAFERHEPGVDDLDADGFGTEVSATTTTPGTAGQLVETSITVTSGQYGSIQPGEQFRLRISRLGDDTSDTMTDNAQLTTVVLEQTADPAGGPGGGFFSDGGGTNAGIGKGSPEPTAAGNEGISHGSGAAATGNYSFAFGKYAEARGNRCIALGENAKAGNASAPANPDSIAIGYGALARAIDSIAIGNGASINNTGRSRGIAIGHGATITDQTDVIAIGYNANARGAKTIVIGAGAQNDSNYHKLIIIGADNHVYNSMSIGGIVIGYGNLVKGNQTNGTVMITTKAGITSGRAHNSGGIVLGGVGWGAGASQTGSPYGNIILIAANGTSPKAGIYFKGTSPNKNIVATVDDNCIHAGYTTTRLCNHNIFMASGNGNNYLFGPSYKSVIIGMSGFSDAIGLSGGQCYSEYNVFIGTPGPGDNVKTGTGGYSKGNVGIGYKFTAIGYEYGYGNVAIGMRVYNDLTASLYTKGSVAIGYNCYVRGPGFGNISMGYQNYLYNTTYANPYEHTGNAILGARCITKPMSGTARLQSTFAQGLNSFAWVSGQRSFAAGGTEDISGNTKPNQASFIIEKHVTSAAGATTVLTYPTQADKAYAIWGWAVARETDADGYNAVFSMANSLVYRNAAGGPTLVGSPVSWTMDANQGSPSWTISTSISSNDVIVQVDQISAAPVSVQWVIELHIAEVRG